MIKKAIRRALIGFMKVRIKNKSFSIISNNCWGGQVYQDLGVDYKTPFVGLFLFSPDYIKMLKNLRFYLGCDLKFIDSSLSRYKDSIDNTKYYPIGVIHDIELHFLHYEDEQNAKEKWDRRLSRLNWDNLFVKFCDRDQCTEQLLNEFDRLEIKNKICFTAKKYNNLKSTVWFKEFSGQPNVDFETNKYVKYFDVVGWLNKGQS